MRLSIKGQIYTIVVLLQPSIWDEINGDAVTGTLELLKGHASAPVHIVQAGHKLVALAYNEWKQRILALQGGS